MLNGKLSGSRRLMRLLTAPPTRSTDGSFSIGFFKATLIFFL
jgi:hypothetical protein